MRWNYLIIPLTVVAVAVGGSLLTDMGIGSGWYDTIAKPTWTPSGGVIGSAWTTIFVLSTIAVLLFWNRHPRGRRFWWIAGLLIANAVLNVGWTYLFFVRHAIGAAVVEAGFLGLSVLLLVVLLWRHQHWAAVLLLPYLVWVGFAKYLTYAIWTLN